MKFKHNETIMRADQTQAVSCKNNFRLVKYSYKIFIEQSSAPSPGRRNLWVMFNRREAAQETYLLGQG